jgi:glycosyltransferase involved in cell wall biosynthesis
MSRPLTCRLSQASDRDLSMDDFHTATATASSATTLNPAGSTRPGSGRPVGGLRIAVVAPPWFSIPPSGYGGIEEMVAGLVDALVDRGHHVTLIGAGPRLTRAQEFAAIYQDPPSERLGDPMPEVVQAAAAWRILSEVQVDVIHDNTLAGPLAACSVNAPTVVTAHGAIAGEYGRYFHELGERVHLVAISDRQRRTAPHLNWVGRVHNAVDVGSFPLGEGAGGYLLFMGRFSPDKGAHLAIDAAKAAGRRLLLAGKLNEPAERAYFEAAVRPHLGPGVSYVGEADATTKRELYAGAAALMFPVCWEEPFGMVMVEAMACGTPVVALRRGSVPEVVDHGRTGLVVDRPEQLTEAIRRVEAVSRAACRRHVERRFDVPVMADGYERAFRSVLSRRAQVQAPPPTLGPRRLAHEDVALAAH